MVPRILKCSSPYEKITLTKRFYGEPKMVLLRHYEKPFPTKVQWKGSMMELKSFPTKVQWKGSMMELKCS